jgi:hypothetical protein
MSAVTYRGVVRDGLVALRDQNHPLTEGTEVLVTPVSDARGSGAAIIAALDNSPRVPAEWVDELEELIAQGRRQVTHADQSHAERSNIVMLPAEWQAFCDALDAPPRVIPALRELLTKEDDVFGKKHDGKKTGQ